MKNISVIFLILSAVMFSQKSVAQNGKTDHQIPLQQIYQLADEAYGSDDELVNGEVFYQKNLYAAGHPFYLSDNWLNGWIMINGTSHKNVELKYNIVSSELILKATLKSGRISPIVLNNSFVDIFSIHGHIFIRADSVLNQMSGTELLELIYEGDFTFYASHHKTFVSDYNNKTPYGKHSSVSSKFYLVHNGNIEKINSNKSLISHFESNKKEIKRYIKKNKFKSGKADKLQWVELLSYCEKLNNDKSQ